MSVREEKAHRIALKVLKLMEDHRCDNTFLTEGQWLQFRELRYDRLLLRYAEPMASKLQGWTSISFLIVHYRGRKVFDCEWNDRGYLHATTLKEGAWLKLLDEDPT